MNTELLQSAQSKMQKAFDFLADELKTLRTGRATPALIDQTPVEVYGQSMQLKQLASISAPDGKSLTVSPWDHANLEIIDKALRAQKELDLNPVSDGKALHINLPPLTAERREQIVKQVDEKVENCQIVLRNIRHEILTQAKNQQKSGDLSEDDYHWLEKQLTTKTDELRAQIEKLAGSKRQELREV